MKTITLKTDQLLLVVLILASLSASAQSQRGPQKVIANLYAKGEPAPAQNFTGTVLVNMLVDPTSGVNCVMGSVTFEPGARTNWHTHAGGQVLMVTDGTGYYQEKGKFVRMIRRGDVVVCQPNVQHWHGASPSSRMTHIATVPDANKPGSTVWLGKVTDAEYMGQPEK